MTCHLICASRQVAGNVSGSVYDDSVAWQPCLQVVVKTSRTQVSTEEKHEIHWNAMHIVHIIKIR